MFTVNFLFTNWTHSSKCDVCTLIVFIMYIIMLCPRGRIQDLSEGRGQEFLSNKKFIIGTKNFAAGDIFLLKRLKKSHN